MRASCSLIHSPIASAQRAVGGRGPASGAAPQANTVVHMSTLPAVRLLFEELVVAMFRSGSALPLPRERNSRWLQHPACRATTYDGCAAHSRQATQCCSTLRMAALRRLA